MYVRRRLAKAMRIAFPILQMEKGLCFIYVDLRHPWNI